MQIFKKQIVQMSWIGLPPPSGKKAALLIPEYNEGSKKNFRSRLEYFKKIANEFRNVLDVIIIDDGSTDGSLMIIESFKEQDSGVFFALSVSPNLNKVGALCATVLSIDHEFVILSDFDTDIKGLDMLFKDLAVLRVDSSLMGCYFRMLPFEGDGSVFLFQQLEYSMARCCYKFHHKERSVPVMPGAGCCYKRETLVDIYAKHSGLRSGEDREATLLGLQLGYKTFYFESILTLTRPPMSFKSLIKQRIRWNLGYIETFNKEKEYYFHQIRKFTKIGIRTLADIIRVKAVLLLPFVILVGIFINWRFTVLYLITIYCTSVFWSVNAMLFAPEESSEFKRKRVHSILSYPLFKIPLDCIAWSMALLSFIRSNHSK